MNRVFCAIVLILTATSLAPTQTNETDKEHAKWIASVIDSVQKIKPGMTREDLLKVFTTEGGESTRFQRTYVYKGCPYIKVNVEFEAVTNPDDHLTEMPKDKIVKISMPFLQYSIGD